MLMEKENEFKNMKLKTNRIVTAWRLKLRLKTSTNRIESELNLKENVRNLPSLNTKMQKMPKPKLFRISAVMDAYNKINPGSSYRSCKEMNMEPQKNYRSGI